MIIDPTESLKRFLHPRGRPRCRAEAEDKA